MISSCSRYCSRKALIFPARSLWTDNIPRIADAHLDCGRTTENVCRHDGSVFRMTLMRRYSSVSGSEKYPGVTDTNKRRPELRKGYERRELDAIIHSLCQPFRKSGRAECMEGALEGKRLARETNLKCGLFRATGNRSGSSPVIWVRQARGDRGIEAVQLESAGVGAGRARRSKRRSSMEVRG